jgi:hypothetical protein
MSVHYQTQEIVSGSTTKDLRSYYASSGIAVGMAVFWDTSKTGEQKCEYVVPAPITSKDYCGIAITSASAGGIVQVQHSGYCGSILVSGSVAVGGTLCVSDGNAGYLEEVASPHGRDHARHATALSTATSGFTTIDGFIYPTA